MRFRRITARHGVLAALLTLAIALPAAAYGGTGSSVASQPLTGRVPGVAVRHQRLGFSVAGYNYRIVVEPSLAGGTAGWTNFLIYSLPHSPGQGGGGGGGYPTKVWPFFADSGGFTIGYVPGHAPRGDVVDYVLTGPEVAAVRVGKLTIATFSDPRLPAGDRAAVFFRRAAAPPAEVIPGIYRPRHAVRVVALDAAGEVIRTRFPLSQSSTPTRYWQAPSAVTPSIQEPPYHGPTHPLPGACELAQHGLPGLVPEWGHVIGRIRPVTNAEGEVFLSCIDTEYYLHGWPLDAGVLLDAAQPGQVLGPIPGARPVLGHPGVVNLAAGQFPGSLTAKQVGQAWLVVQGGASLRQRLRVLQALELTKLDLRHTAQDTSPRPVNAQILANFAPFRRPRTKADELPASIKLTVRYCSGPFSEGGSRYASIQGLEAWSQIQCSSIANSGPGVARRPALRQFVDGVQRDQSRAVRLPGRLGTIWLVPSGRWLCDLLRFGAAFHAPPPPGFPPGGGITWSAACEPISEVLARPPLWPGGIWAAPSAPAGGYLFGLEPDAVTKVTLDYHPAGSQRTYLADNVVVACRGQGSAWLEQTGPTMGAIRTSLGGGNLSGRPARYRPEKCRTL